MTETASHIALLAPVPLEHLLDGKNVAAIEGESHLGAAPGKSSGNLTSFAKFFRWTPISTHLTLTTSSHLRSHGIPHFHAKYGGQTGVVSIPDLQLIAGRLPKRVVALVLVWAFEHRKELLANWERVLAQKSLQPIPPLE